MTTVLLDVKDLHTRFKMRDRFVYAVNGVSFQLRRGETLGVVGESGSGKSVTMMSLLRLLPPSAQITDGEVLLEGKDILKMSGRQLRKVRGAKVGMIFQDPMTSLNPVLKIGVQMAEALVYHQDMSKQDALVRCAELLELVGIADGAARLQNYPHELSGGQRQRVMIAMALACQPDVLIADEPTTALDVTIQAQIIELVKDLRDNLESAIIWITHDLALIAGLADRVLVMYGGTVVEEASVDELYENPSHPYTEGLLGALPSVGETRNERLVSIEGKPPNLSVQPTFCPFVDRCKYAIAKCMEERPALAPVPGLDDAEHRIACWVDIRKSNA